MHFRAADVAAQHGDTSVDDVTANVKVSQEKGSVKVEQAKVGQPRRNDEIVRNVLAPKGFGRRRAVCFVAAPLRCHHIASSRRLASGPPALANHQQKHD